MRTTLTLEDDVATDLKRLVSERGSTFKETVNQLLRQAMRLKPDLPPYESPTFSSGTHPGVDLDQASKLAAELEDAEIIRKIEMRK